MHTPTPREETYFQLIKWLNKQKFHGTRTLFDCGELGFALICWGRSRWKVDWLEAQPIPFEVTLEIDNARNHDST